MKKILVFTLSILAVQTALASEFSFLSIMKLAENKAITYERVGYYERPFKIYKDGSKWILEQQINGESSEIVDEKNGKFSTTDFPDNWTANGTWAFTKKGDKCRIDHEDGDMNMTWNC